MTTLRILISILLAIGCIRSLKNGDFIKDGLGPFVLPPLIMLSCAALIFLTTQRKQRTGNSEIVSDRNIFITLKEEFVSAIAYIRPLAQRIFTSTLSYFTKAFDEPELRFYVKPTCGNISYTVAFISGALMIIMLLKDIFVPLRHAYAGVFFIMIMGFLATAHLISCLGCYLSYRFLNFAIYPHVTKHLKFPWIFFCGFIAFIVTSGLIRVVLISLNIIDAPHRHGGWGP